jgi:uncharacterized membrane protein (DUF106 family)
MLGHCATTVICAFATAALSELMSWVLLYRHPEYQSSKKKLEVMAANFAKAKEETEAASAASEPKLKKRERKIKAILTDMQRKMMVSTMKSTMLMSFSMMFIMYQLNSRFSGIVVAKLPFTPFGFLQNMSHRNLQGDDYTECSMIFLYIMCGMAIRSNIKKALGHEPPKGMPNAWEPPSEEEMAKQWK